MGEKVIESETFQYSKKRKKSREQGVRTLVYLPGTASDVGTLGRTGYCTNQTAHKRSMMHTQDHIIFVHTQEHFRAHIRAEQSRARDGIITH